MNLSQLVLSGLMLLAGVGIPIMAAMNAGLGVRVSSPMAAVAVLCLIALVLSVVLLCFAGVPAPANFHQVPPTYYLAGALFILYMASITFAAPRIGLANAVFYVLLGQLISAAVIDHFGLWDAIRSEITTRRLLGLIVMAAGVYLARKDVVSSVPLV